MSRNGKPAQLQGVAGWRRGESFLNTAHMNNTRRALVLTDESAGHPFLRSLPVHVRKGTRTPADNARGWKFTRRDWRDFLGAYCASFVMVSAFIA